jgi:cell division control protein 6
VMVMGDVCQIRMVAEQNGMSEDYLPQKLIGREHQIDMIMQCLAPARNKLRPLHLHLYGGPGTGKTAIVRHVLKHLNETAGLESVVVNCWEKDSFFAILDDIISQLGILRAESHRSCVKLDRLGRHLNHRPFIIVLDEIDKLKRSERSATLYNLVSLDKVGIICITGEETSLELEDRVRSRLCPYYVHFLPYRRQELMAILAHRAQVALTTRVWSDSLLEEIADMAAGDARVAIRALKDMAELAEAGDSDTLSGSNGKVPSWPGRPPFSIASRQTIRSCTTSYGSRVRSFRGTFGRSTCTAAQKKTESRWPREPSPSTPTGSCGWA